METVDDLPGLRSIISGWRREGLRIAFVPTMGNLHDGHLSLLDQARTMADRTVASIFVNPIQFGKGEDYGRYPSTFTQDQEKLAGRDLDALFVPDLEQIYPAGIESDTRVSVPALSSILCGRFRPGHFSGVATVVTKLFVNVQPDVALFGEKDYQQLLVIRRMTRELCMPIEIIGVPIMREAGGLAMSSRNQYLTQDERRKACLIFKTLQAAAQRLRRTPGDISGIEAEAMLVLESAGFRPEYFSIRRSDDLLEPGADDKKLTILVAAWLGAARLIDNVHLQLEG